MFTVHIIFVKIFYRDFACYTHIYCEIVLCACVCVRVCVCASIVAICLRHVLDSSIVPMLCVHTAHPRVPVQRENRGNLVLNIVGCD